MADLDAALQNLGFDRAANDATRARLLFAIHQFAQEVGDELLQAKALELAPAANPFSPPKKWLRGFTRGFENAADDDAGTDSSSGDLQGRMLWEMSSDEWRRARVADSESQGYDDGETEADAQNNLT